MKNNFLKFYVAVFYFCATFVSFADPGVDNEDGDLEDVDIPVGIDEYVWVLVALGLLFMYLKFKSISKTSKSQEI